MQEKENTQESDKKVNPNRSPFTKPDNERQNLHSLSEERDEIAPGRPDRDIEEERKIEDEPWRDK